MRERVVWGHVHPVQATLPELRPADLPGLQPLPLLNLGDQPSLPYVLHTAPGDGDAGRFERVHPVSGGGQVAPPQLATSRITSGPPSAMMAVAAEEPDDVWSGTPPSRCVSSPSAWRHRSDWPSIRWLSRRTSTSMTAPPVRILRDVSGPGGRHRAVTSTTRIVAPLSYGGSGGPAAASRSARAARRAGPAACRWAPRVPSCRVPGLPGRPRVGRSKRL